MESINWFQVRHYIKWTLISITVLFFLVTIVKLLTIKQFYIKRYVKLHLIEDEEDNFASFDGHHKVFQVDEEIDLAKFNLTESPAYNNNNNTRGYDTNKTMINLPVEHGHNKKLPSEEDNSDPDGSDNWQNRFSTEVKFITGIIVAVIIVVEMLYCVLYLYIIAQKQFGSMLCFTILSALTLAFYIKLYFTISLEDIDQHSSPYIGNSHQGDNFLQHIDSLDPETLINNITHNSPIEVILLAMETTLAIVYSAILFKFPGRRRIHCYRFFRFGGRGGGIGGNRRRMVNNIQLANGHVTAIELNPINEPQHNNDQDAGSHSQSSSSSISSVSDCGEETNHSQQMADITSNHSVEPSPMCSLFASSLDNMHSSTIIDTKLKKDYRKLIDDNDVVVSINVGH